MEETITLPREGDQPYKLLLKLAQRIADLLVEAREDGLGLLDCLLLNIVISMR